MIYRAHQPLLALDDEMDCRGINVTIDYLSKCEAACQKQKHTCILEDYLAEHSRWKCRNKMLVNLASCQQIGHIDSSAWL